MIKTTSDRSASSLDVIIYFIDENYASSCFFFRVYNFGELSTLAFVADPSLTQNLDKITIPIT